MQEDLRRQLPIDVRRSSISSGLCDNFTGFRLLRAVEEQVFGKTSEALRARREHGGRLAP